MKVKERGKRTLLHITEGAMLVSEVGKDRKRASTLGSTKKTCENERERGKKRWEVRQKREGNAEGGSTYEDKDKKKGGGEEKKDVRS